MNEPTCTIDFESRSACNIKHHGAWRYSTDPSTEVLCMAYRLPWMDEGETGLWHPSFPSLDLEEHREPSLDEVFEWIADGGLISAHNAQFEVSIWQNISVPRYGWPAVPIQSWRCTAVKAAAHALPRSLGDAGAALGLDIQKDSAGHKLMLKVSKPRKPRKKEREQWMESHTSLSGMSLLWWESPSLFSDLHAYCRQDVLAEVALSEALPDCSPDEQALYTLDQTINQRGFRLDREAVECALELIASETTALNSELAALTGGAVTRATQRARLVKWFANQGLHLADTRKETIDSYLRPALPPPTGPVMECPEHLVPPPRYVHPYVPRASDPIGDDIPF